MSHRPIVIEVEDAVGTDQPDPNALPQSQTPWDDSDEALAMLRQAQKMQGLAGRRRSGFARFAIWVFGATFSFVLSVAAWEFITNLLQRNALLGTVGFALMVATVLCCVVFALREWWGYRALTQLDGLRARAKAAQDLKSAQSVVHDLSGLYHTRADLTWAMTKFNDRRADVLDADALLALAENDLVAPLDAQARAQIEANVRRVSLVTAVVPVALADVAVVLYSNLKMIRQIAEIYGGRSGVLGSWSLLRKVFTSLLATGAVSLVDDLMGSVAGGGLLSKLSKRLGEGVVNGALTARIGLAAMELCRPLPFVAQPRPAVSSLLSRALGGLLPARAKQDD